MTAPPTNGKWIYFFGEVNGEDIKIGKNVLPTLSLTLQSAKAARFVIDGRPVVANTCPLIRTSAVLP